MELRITIDKRKRYTLPSNEDIPFHKKESINPEGWMKFIRESEGSLCLREPLEYHQA